MLLKNHAMWIKTQVKRLLKILRNTSTVECNQSHKHELLIALKKQTCKMKVYSEITNLLNQWKSQNLILLIDKLEFLVSLLWSYLDASFI